MNLTLANIGINVVYYGMTATLGPWLVLTVEDWLGIPRHPALWLRLLAIVLGSASIALQMTCIILLQWRGRGTPSPARPTTHLITSGPYRFVRNPLNVGELGLFLALAAWFGSGALLAYAILAACAFHLFILHWEEPRLAAAMGDEYAHYRAAVNRWLPAAGLVRKRIAGCLL